MQPWKQVEKSASYRRGKLILRRLAGKELWFRPTAERPAVTGGWPYQVERLTSDSVVYSVGVGDDISFDLELIARFGLHVHAFDPIPSVATWVAAKEDLPEQFHFHPWAVAGNDTTLKLYPRAQTGSRSAAFMYTTVEDAGSTAKAVEVPAYSLATICQKLGHERVDLLKMDIEGTEYEVLSSMLSSALRPRQLLVEFHHRFSGLGLQDTEEAIDALVAHGYELSAVSDAGREYCFCLNDG